MNLVRFNPFFSEAESLQNEFNRIFNETGEKRKDGKLDACAGHHGDA
jgi:hypothetical protein